MSVQNHRALMATSSSVAGNPQPVIVAPVLLPVQVRSELPAAEPPAVPFSDSPEHFFHKNRLQHYTQKLSIPLPVYHTINEGLPHAPLFRSTVLVNEESYTSPNTYSHRKAAEQDVAKYALTCISAKWPSQVEHQAEPQNSSRVELMADGAPQPSIAKLTSAAEYPQPPMVTPLLSVLHVKSECLVAKPLAEIVPSSAAEDPQPTLATEDPRPTLATEDPQPTLATEDPQPTLASEDPQPTLASEDPHPTLAAENSQPILAAEDLQPTLVNPASSIGQVKSELPAAKLPAETVPPLDPGPYNDCPAHLSRKNSLFMYTQMSSIPSPIYQAINEGLQHFPKFRATVTVGGASYSSQSTYSHRKLAEHDAAKYALDCISKKLRDEGAPLILTDTTFCKSILIEFATKMSMEKPTYSTIQSEGSIPTFVSTAIFNGVSYIGDAGKSKKEAEQLAARAVILSHLGNVRSETLLSWIIKSKAKFYAGFPKVNDTTVPVAIPSQGNEYEPQEQVAGGNPYSSVAPISEIPGGYLAAAPVSDLPIREFKKPKLTPSRTISSLFTFAPPIPKQNSSVSSTPSKKRKRKNKKNTEVLPAASASASSLPANPAPSCSVAQ